MVCPQEQEPVRTFFGEGGSVFRDFVRISFMGGPKQANTELFDFLILDN